MTTTSSGAASEVVVLTDATSGVALIPQPTALTRLNYFDGKFLRADDLRVEQDYLRALIGFGNQAGGSGPVHGLSVRASGADALELGAGLALDPDGRTLLLPWPATIDLAQLIDRADQLAPATGMPGSGEFGDCTSRANTPGTAPISGGRYYLISIAHTEALCGEEDVYGKLCEEACITSTDRPYRLEGLVVIATPFGAATPFATSTAVTLGGLHQRSLLASAFFADEQAAAGSLISAAGLRSEAWCRGAGAPNLPPSVPVAVISRSGGVLSFVDDWTVRRERMEAPPKRYWAGRMAQRPWDVFLAQVLQFQCQLADLGTVTTQGADDPSPCRSQHEALGAALSYLDELTSSDGGDDPVVALAAHAGAAGDAHHLRLDHARIAAVRKRLSDALSAVGDGTGRILIDGGIVELPPAGYLPVVPGATPPVDQQVRQLLGAGVDLRFRTVRADMIGAEFELGQHMDRISLLTGLDDPTKRQEVDILVPDGIVDAAPAPTADGWDMTIWADPREERTPAEAEEIPATRSFVHALAGSGTQSTSGAAKVFDLLGAFGEPASAAAEGHGAARLGTAPGGGPELFAAAASSLSSGKDGNELIKAFGSIGHADGERGVELLRRITGRPVGAARAGTDEATAAAEERTARAVEEVRTHLEGDRAAATWLTATCDRDPFTAVGGAPVPVSATAIIGKNSGQRATLTRSTFIGTLVDIELTSRTTGSGERVLRGRLQGLAKSETIVAGHVTESTGGEVDLPVQLADRSGTNGRLFELAIATDDRTRINVVGGIGTSGGERKAFVSASQIRRPAHESEPGSNVERASAFRRDEFVRALFTADRDYANPARPPFQLADAGLTALGRVLDDASFKGTSEALLFPTAEPGAASARATRDWVLFRRRRPEQIATQPVPPAPVATTTYAVFAQTPKGTLAHGAISRFRQLGEVTFQGAGTSIAAGGQAVLSAWDDLVPNAAVRRAAIGLVPAADGTSARQRLATVVQLVDPGSTAELSTLVEGVPPAVAVAGTDGSIILVPGEVQQQTTCSTFVAIPGSQEGWGIFNASDANVGTAMQRTPEVQHLGRLHYPPAGDTTSDDDTPVVNAMQAALPTPAGSFGVLVIVARTADEPASDETLRARARTVASGAGITLDGDIRVVTVQSIPDAWQIDCPSVVMYSQHLVLT